MSIKNIFNVPSLSNCNFCGLDGFFSATHQGADYYTCPCCNEYAFLNSAQDDKYDFLFGLDNDIRYDFHFCLKCGIIFKLGCIHANAGCTDDNYNVHFIQQWKNKLTGEVFDNGMPYFANEDEWFENANNVIVLKLFCPHSNAICKKSIYPVKKGCSIVKEN